MSKLLEKIADGYECVGYAGDVSSLNDLRMKLGIASLALQNAAKLFAVAQKEFADAVLIQELDFKRVD